MRRLRLIAVLAALLAWGGPVAAADALDFERVLRFNPFARPDFEAMGRSAGASGAFGDGSAWAPVLTATLVAGEGSLANLGGFVLAIGEETHGYRLAEVKLWEAAFEKDGSTLILPLVPRDEQVGP